MKISSSVIYSLLLATPLLTSCQSKPETLTGIHAGRFSSDVLPGAYYRTGLTPTAFYDVQPDSLIAKTPTDILGPRHVLQLLSANGGGVWARVRTEEDLIGFVRFSSINIVPREKRPDAPKRKNDKWFESSY
jgi:hypothetical protein